MVLRYLLKFCIVPLPFLNFYLTPILPALFEAIVMHCTRGEVFAEISLCKNNNSLWRVLFKGGVKNIS